MTKIHPWYDEVRSVTFPQSRSMQRCFANEFCQIGMRFIRMFSMISKTRIGRRSVWYLRIYKQYCCLLWSGARQVRKSNAKLCVSHSETLEDFQDLRLMLYGLTLFFFLRNSMQQV